MGADSSGCSFYLCLVFWYSDMLFARYFVVKRYNPGDLDLYYRGGVMLRRGERDIYNRKVYDRYFARDPETKKSYYKLHYRINYPPLVYAMFVPFSKMKLGALKGLWFYFNCLLLIGTVVLIFFTKPFQAMPDGFRYLLCGLFLVFAFCFSPVNETLFRGQMNILLLFMVVLGIFFYDRGNPILAGVFIAVASSLKLIPLVLVVFFLVRKEWKAIIAMVITLMVIHLGLIVVFGPDLMKSFVTHWPSTMDGLIAHEFNKSFDSLLYRLFSKNSISSPLIIAPALVRPLGIVKSLIVLIGMIFVLKRMADRAFDDRVLVFLGFCLVFQSFFLISFLLFGHHLVLMLPALAICAGLAGNPNRDVPSGKLPLYLFLLSGMLLGGLAGIIPNTFHFAKHGIWAGRILFNHKLFAQPLIILSWIFLVWFIFSYMSTLNDTAEED